MSVSSRSRLTAADVMTRGPLTCDIRSPVLDAVRIFRQADCGAVPVLDLDKLVGVLTDRDVALALAEHEDTLINLPVGAITVPGVVTVNQDLPLSEVIARFGDRAVRRLLVTDAAGTLVGIIGWADVAVHATDLALGKSIAQIVKAP
ncbi:MAG: CBS domain-containing protein [Isosphaeraceae bacterium]